MTEKPTKFDRVRQMFRSAGPNDRLFPQTLLLGTAPFHIMVVLLYMRVYDEVHK